MARTLEMDRSMIRVPAPTGEAGLTSRVPNGEIPTGTPLDQVRAYRDNAQVIWGQQAELQAREAAEPGSVAPIVLLVAKRASEYIAVNFDPRQRQVIKSQVANVTIRRILGY